MTNFLKDRITLFIDKTHVFEGKSCFDRGKTGSQPTYICRYPFIK